MHSPKAHTIPCHLAPGLALFAWLLVLSGARADYLVLDLKVAAGGTSMTAPSEMLAVGVSPKPRGVLEAKVNERITVQWKVRHAAKEGTVKNVLLHLFVAREEKLGQLAPPKLGKDVIAESALTMDFQPKDETQGELSFTIAKAGFYLLRLETIGAAVGAEGHEHFAALDLSVK